MLKLTY